MPGGNFFTGLVICLDSRETADPNTGGYDGRTFP